MIVVGNHSFIVPCIIYPYSGHSKFNFSFI